MLASATSGQEAAGVHGLGLVAGAEHMEAVEPAQRRERVVALGGKRIGKEKRHALASPGATQLTTGRPQRQTEVGDAAPAQRQDVAEHGLGRATSTLLLQHNAVAGERNHRNVAAFSGCDNNAGGGDCCAGNGVAGH